GFYKFFHTFAVLDSLLVGLLIAYADQHRMKWLSSLRRFPHLCLLFGLFFVYGACFTEMTRFWQTNFLFGGQALGFGLILIATLGEKFALAGLLSHRRLASWAALSYGIYLSHDKPLYY